jgi:hypothetical protein
MAADNSGGVMYVPINIFIVKCNGCRTLVVLRNFLLVKRWGMCKRYPGWLICVFIKYIGEINV